MHRFRILYLTISSCVALVLSSCAVKTVDGFQQKAPLAETYAATYFSDPARDYVYKAHISVYGNDFGGIFIAKRINDTTHRVAFTTEFGNKLFDFEIGNNGFKVNHILEELDRKIIVNTLRKDFTLLLKKEHKVEGMYENADFYVFKSKDAKRFNYLFQDRKTKRLAKIVNATKAKEKVIITFVPETDKLAKNIVIDHKNIKLKIELNYIEN